MHEDITNVYMIESGLRRALGKNLGTVKTIQNVWNWLRIETLLPTLFNQEDAHGAPLSNKTFWSRVLTYNQLCGPLVLEQSRSRKERCQDGEGIAGTMMCYPQKTESTESFGRNISLAIAEPEPAEYRGANVTLKQREAYYRSSFSPAVPSSSTARRLRTMRHEYMRWLPNGPKGDDDKFMVFVYPNTPIHLIQEHFGYLYQRAWLDAQTKQVSVKALLLNAEVGRPRLEQYQVLFRFSRAGEVFERMTMESLFLEFASGTASLVFDFLFVVCLCFLTGVELRNLFEAIKRGRCKQLFRHFWTMFQWLIVIGGWVVISCYLAQAYMRMNVVSKLKAVISSQAGDIPAEVNDSGQDLFETTDGMLGFTSWFRILLADYHLLTMFFFFKAFQAQPRLGVVTSTLEACLVDILHFLVVLLPTFMAYAISGCFIFGRRMEGFSTFDGAICVCFKMAMEGEYDWDELSTEHYWTAALWTWTFMLLIVLLMLNMVLAIVMDVYASMRKNTGRSETVVELLLSLFQRAYHWRRWVSNQALALRLQSMHRLVSREELLEEFPGMCDEQLNCLMAACRHRIESAASQDNEMKDSMKMTMAIKLGVDKVIDELTRLSDVDTEERDAAAPGKFQVSTDGRGWLQEASEQMAVQNHELLSIQWQLQQLHWQWQTIEAMYGTNVDFEKLARRKSDENDPDFIL